MLKTVTTCDDANDCFDDNDDDDDDNDCFDNDDDGDIYTNNPGAAKGAAPRPLHCPSFRC